VDNHKWNEITEQHIAQLYNTDFKSKLVSVIRKEYFLEILAGRKFRFSLNSINWFYFEALAILSKIEHSENISRVFEFEMFNQMSFLLFTFGTKQYLTIRSCQNLNQIIQQTIHHCQLRNYIPTVYILLINKN
jgi:hypothetical protein